MSETRIRFLSRSPRRLLQFALALVVACAVSAPLETAVAGCGKGNGASRTGCCGKCRGRSGEATTGDPAVVPGPGHVPGRGNRPGGGPRGVRNADGHHEVIQSLLAEHGKIRRQVEVVDHGVVTVTTSDDPEVAAKIREHVAQMRARLASGDGVRHWDPLFAELFAHHDEVRMTVEDVPGGIRVRETSNDPAVQALIRQHAIRAVSEFVERGYDRAHETTPLPDDHDTPAVASGGNP